MANIFDYNYERVMSEHPDLRDRTNYDWLVSTPGAKYTTGTKGIANAYIPTDERPLIINEKNAMYALIFAASVRCVDEDFRFYDESRNFDKMLYALLPSDDDAALIHDPFYRRLFSRSGIKDDVRNALNSKAFERLFQYEVKSRYVCVIPTYGSQYTEDEIRGLAEEIYQSELQEEMDKTGRVGLTSLSRCLVQERCSRELKEKYGWEFDHREYGDVIIDEDLLAEVRLAYPHIAKVVDDALAALNTDKDKTPSTGLMKLASTDLNPIANCFVYQRSLLMGLINNEELIGWTEDDYMQWLKRRDPDEVVKREECLRDEYMRICVRDFVLKTNDKREVYPIASYVEQVIDDITIYIRNRQIRLTGM